MPSLPPTSLHHNHQRLHQVQLEVPHSHAYKSINKMSGHYQTQSRSYPTARATTTNSASQYQHPHPRHTSSTTTTASPPVSTSSSRSSLSLEPREDVAEWCHQMHMMQRRRYDWCHGCHPSPAALSAVPSYRIMQNVRSSREESHAYQ